MTALLLIFSLFAGQFFGTVHAEEYEQSATEIREEGDESQKNASGLAAMENGPYAIYEMMTPEQRSTYYRIQQFNQKRQQWLQSRLPYTTPRNLELEAAVAMEAALKQVNEAKSRITTERARYEEELRNTWHHPLTVDTFVTSPFGYRWHPVYGTYRMHNGVDLNAYYGDEVRASRGGIVADAGWNEYYGYYVRIDHGDGFMTEYFHLCTYYVDEGQEVRYCEPIGQAGSTGVSTGTHLHFGMLYEDEYVDPEDYIDF